MRQHSLLTLQKRAADRSALCHLIACQRIAEGYLGAALFYQHEAARMHQRACELREQMNGPQPPFRILNFRISDCKATARFFDPCIPPDLFRVVGERG